MTTAYLKLTCSDRRDTLVHADFVGPLKFGRRVLAWVYPYDASNDRARRAATVRLCAKRAQLDDEHGVSDVLASAYGDELVQLPEVGVSC